jgi:hypothetical protein
MQTKTIRKNIELKMEQWLTTITDEKLRVSVKNSLLVSGGCITSMFLNEDVNDYDIYIQDLDVLSNLVEYYVTPFKKYIQILDGRDKDNLVNELGLRTGIYAISVRNLQKDQIKLFITGGGGFLNADFKEDELKYMPKFFSPNAISLTDNIQIVIRFHGDHSEIHKNFDFIHATNYFTFKEGLVTNKEALESILTKQLKYQGSLYPLTSILRMKKFIKRNWNINAGEVLKIMFQISELNLKDMDILEEQLIGIDVSYFSMLINLLRELPEDKKEPKYINTLIDKIFNDSEETGT